MAIKYEIVNDILYSLNTSFQKIEIKDEILEEALYAKILIIDNLPLGIGINKFSNNFLQFSSNMIFREHEQKMLNALKTKEELISNIQNIVKSLKCECNIIKNNELNIEEIGFIKYIEDAYIEDAFIDYDTLTGDIFDFYYMVRLMRKIFNSLGN